MFESFPESPYIVHPIHPVNPGRQGRISALERQKTGFAHIEIEARGEGLSLASQHDRADGIVAFRLVERAAQVLHHLAIHCVELLGPVERDDRDGSLGFVVDGLV